MRVAYRRAEAAYRAALPSVLRVVLRAVLRAVLRVVLLVVLTATPGSEAKKLGWGERNTV